LVRLTFQLAGEKQGGLQLFENLLAIERISSGQIFCADEESNQITITGDQLGMVQKVDATESIFIICRSITCQLQDKEHAKKVLYVAMQAAVLEMQIQIKNLEAVLKTSVYRSSP